MKKHNDLDKLRHSCAHLLAAAVVKLYPEAKPTIGPPIETGFYYDFDFGEKKISDSDLGRIEKIMQELVTTWREFKKINLTPKQAKKIFSNNPYKLELIDELIINKQPITAYQSGDFIDLCRGGHIENPRVYLKHFKLLTIAGAYWRGDTRNKMLTRIYGTAFFTSEELEKYLWQLEEAKKRDHRILGKDLELFYLTPEVGSGLMVWLPNGAVIRKQIEDLIIKEQLKRGYLHVYTPHLGNKNLWVTSGHWELYRDKMYSPVVIDEDEYLVKPMNCPFHMMVYKSQPRSYKDLPLRIAEIATVYRYEKTGELSGMLRVRHITQDDAHIFCTENQVVDEFLAVFDLIIFLLKVFGLKDYYLRLGLRSKKEKYLGNDKLWKEAEEKILQALERRDLKYQKSEGDAAFYGPKLDIVVQDAIGRSWQCGTIQVDFMLPKRFGLEFVDRDGKRKQPVLIHRAPLGSLERWVGLLIEHYQGKFPLWLSPLQLIILPLSKKHNSTAYRIRGIFEEHGFRVIVDDEAETLNKKIRRAILKKIPYLIIIGKKEEEKSARLNQFIVSVKTREGKDLGQISINEFVKNLKNQIENFQ